MQKQKTIAKWLAVILLMTVAVACYIALSAIVGKNPDGNSNVAGANDDNNQENVDNPTIKPVYSVLPRKSETVNGASVAHVGGEGEEKVLDVFYFAKKTALVFHSQSEQYDVKEKGIYIAIFDGETLEKTLKIASENDKYLSSCQTRNGVAIFTCDGAKTNVRIYDGNFDVSCENALDSYDEINANYYGYSIEAFCVKNGKIKRLVIDDSLRVKSDNFVLQTTAANVVQTIKYGGSTLLFLQDEQTAVGVSYDTISGFTKRFSYDKHRILQIMPVIQSNVQCFAALFETQNGLRVSLLSLTLSENAEYIVNGENFGALFRSENGLKILLKNRIIRLCSHLEFISETPLSNIDVSSGNRFESSGKTLDGASGLTSQNGAISLEKANDFSCVWQEENMLVARFENFDCLLKLNDNELAVVATLKYAENVFATTSITDGQNKLSIFFDADSDSTSTYMCFGKTDAFFLSVLTSGK